MMRLRMEVLLSDLAVSFLLVLSCVMRVQLSSSGNVVGLGRSRNSISIPKVRAFREEALGETWRSSWLMG